MQDYQIIKEIGQGGYGRALLVKHRETGNLYVMKEVRLLKMSQKDRESALAEARILSSLNHPYIVHYSNAFQERGCLYIVMSYADGGDLSQKIQQQGQHLLSENKILTIFAQLCLAIKYIHDRKIIHRDLKSQNVFLMKDGSVRLGDFGIACVLEHTCQQHKTQIGTPYYMSPEIAQGHSYSFKTDIWSLGCILYELCSLKHAFQAGNMNALLCNIIRGRYPPVSTKYSPELRSLLDSLLVTDPLNRPSITQIIHTPIIQKQLSEFLELSTSIIKGLQRNPSIDERKKWAAEQRRKIEEQEKKLMEAPSDAEIRRRIYLMDKQAALENKKRANYQPDPINRDFISPPPVEQKPQDIDAMQRRALFEEQRRQRELNRLRCQADMEGRELTQEEIESVYPKPKQTAVKEESDEVHQEEDVLTNHTLYLDEDSLTQEVADCIKEALEAADLSIEENNDQPLTFYIDEEREVKFPSVKDNASKAYRSEAIRAFLEKEIGLDKLIAVKEEMKDNQAIDISQKFPELNPMISVLILHLIILDEVN